MGYRTILAEVAGDAALEPRLHAARRLARRFEATLIGLHVMPTPVIPAMWDGGAAISMGAELIEAQRRANQEQCARLRATFEASCGGDPEALWQEAEGDPARLLAEAARTADLVVAARHESPTLEGRAPVEEVAVGGGVPVLMLPPSAYGEFGRTVLVGWNGAREASRAAHDALPFLRGAELVVLCAVGEEAARSLEAAAAMLHRHGVPVQPQAVDGADGDAGETLLARARAHGADLLVMGAYGHARLRELVFGGATRHVLRESRLPVLFGS